MATLKEWTTLQANWGVPELQPVHESTLQLVEKARVKNPEGHTIIHYNFKVTGLPKDDKYTMEFWQVGGPSHPFQLVSRDVTINADGIVVCSATQACGDKTKKEYPLEVAIPSSLGFPNRFVLTSQKHRDIWVTGLAIPFPIESVSDGCRLEIVRITPNGELLLFSGFGLPANQTIHIDNNSAGESHNVTVQTDAQGHFSQAELPFVIGKTSGTLELKIGQDAPCHPSIQTEWGQGSNHLQ